VRNVKLSYLIWTPFLALLLTALVLLGASNEISLEDFFGQNPHGSPRGVTLYEFWHEFQLAAEYFLALIFDWKLIVFFFVSMLATIFAVLFTWKALQIYLTSAPRPVSPERGLASPAKRKVIGPAPRTSQRRDAWQSGLSGKLSGALSALEKFSESALGFIPSGKAWGTRLGVILGRAVWALVKAVPSALGSMLRRKAWRSGLAGKLSGALSALLIVLGSLILVTVYYHLSGTIQTQVSQRALTTAMNFSDAVAEQFSAKGNLAVHTLLGKYSMAEEIAYIFLTDREGKPLAHNLPVFPAQLQRSSSATAPFQRIVMFRGGRVLETGVPIDKGRLGIAYYGIWKAAIDRQVYRDLAPILGVIGFGIVAGIALSVFLARRIARPIIVLKEGADRMSRGEFDTPVGVHPFEDLGELASSLERLRSSLNAAFIRLNRE